MKVKNKVTYKGKLEKSELGRNFRKSQNKVVNNEIWAVEHY